MTTPEVYPTSNGSKLEVLEELHKGVPPELDEGVLAVLFQLLVDKGHELKELPKGSEVELVVTYVSVLTSLWGSSWPSLTRAKILSAGAASYEWGPE